MGVLLWLALTITACSSSDCVPGIERVDFVSEGPRVEIQVEVVDTPETRQRGLMGRRSLDDDAGMLFMWPTDTTSSFYMKDTLIPLSIAFMAADGTVLRIMDMDPCTADPCPTYDPRTSYRMALEVNQGAFTRWDVQEGEQAQVIGFACL